MESNEVAEFTVDVAVIGGGVTGLWSVRTLRQSEWSVALVTGPTLGGGQTSHSHVYLHRGHLYLKEMQLGTNLVNDLIDAGDSWATWLSEVSLEDRAVPAPFDEGYFGFPTFAVGQDYLSMWRLNALQCAPVPVEDVEPFDRSSLKSLYRVEATCLNATSLIDALASQHRDCLLATREVRVLPGDGRHTVECATDDGLLRVHARVVVLAAGAGNRAFVESINPDHVPTVTDRASFMLIIRGARDVLPPVCGVFWSTQQDNLFIVSRLDGDDVIWLVSTAERDHDLTSWRDIAIATVVDMFPALLERSADLSAGVYFAPKAEIRDNPGDDHEIKSPVVKVLRPGIFAVWPSKLTLAPKAAQLVFDAVATQLGETSPSPQPDFGDLGPKAVAEELWQTVELQQLESLLN